MAASPSPPPAPSPASASPDVPLGSTDSARPLLDGGQEIGGGGDRGGDALRRPFLSLSPLMFHPSAARSLSRVAVATPAAVQSSSPLPFRVLQAHTDPSYLASIARRERNARAHALDKLERQRTEEDRARQQLVDRQEQFRPAHDANDLETGVHAPLREPTQGAAFREHLHHASASVWGIPKLRENQIAAVERILLDATCRGKLHVIDRTGSGKSHILRMVGTMTGGIVLAIVPLLSLTADQMKRLRKAHVAHASVETHHLDEYGNDSKEVVDVIIPRMNAICYNSSSTAFLLASPQFIAESPMFRKALLECYERKTLRVVAIDELHLYAMHGQSFRENIRALRPQLFEKERM